MAALLLAAPVSPAHAVEPTAPYYVDALTAAPDVTTVLLSWKVISDGGSPITGYVTSIDDGNTWKALTAAANSDGSWSGTMTGLTPSTFYDIKLAAVNAIGRGIASGITTTTKAAAPVATAPGIVTALSGTADTATATLSFSPPASDGGSAITAYKYSADGGSTWNSLSTTSGTFAGFRAVISGLTPATAYTFLVVAVNGVGQGSPASVSVTTLATLAVPTAPTGLAAVNDSVGISLTWTAPAGVIVSYVLQVSADNGAWTDLAAPTGATSSYNVINTRPGTAYRFRVAAVNGAGQGPWSGTVSVTRPRLPGGVMNLEATYGTDSRTATLEFSAPLDNGGTPVTLYRIRYRAAGTTAWQTPGTATTTGLTATVTLRTGSPVEWGVMASQYIGDGPIVSTGLLTAASAGTDAQLAWTTPESGGATILNYMVQSRPVGTSAWRTASAGANTRYLLTGLSGGTTYEVRVAANGLNGVISYTPIVTYAPVGVPAAPTALSATGTGTTATVSFAPSAATAGFAATGYQLSTDGGTSWADITTTVVGDRLQFVMSSLAPAATTNILVAGKNDNGRGAGAALSIITQSTAVTLPTNVSVSDKTFAFDTATAAGLPYTYVSTTPTVCTIIGNVAALLAQGSCSFTRSQAGGTSGNAVTLASSANATLIVGAARQQPPAAPTKFTVTIAKGGLRTFAWMPPMGSITGYRIEYAVGADWLLLLTKATATSSSVKSTMNVPSSQWRIAAVNDAGTGAYTAAVFEAPAPVSLTLGMKKGVLGIPTYSVLAASITALNTFLELRTRGVIAEVTAPQAYQPLVEKAVRAALTSGGYGGAVSWKRTTGTSVKVVIRQAP